MLKGWPRQRSLAPLMALCLAAGISPALPASDLEKQVTFHIASQPLESALLEFSRQADVQVAIASAAVGNVHVAGIDGRLPVGSALLILLQGSGLSYSVTGNTVTVTRVVPKALRSAGRSAFENEQASVAHPKSSRPANTPDK